MSPSGVLKVVSDRSATTAAACGPFDADTPAKWQQDHKVQLQQNVTEILKLSTILRKIF